MRPYLLASGVIFALFGLAPFVMIYGHWGEARWNLGFVLMHATIGICCAALSIWAFRLSRRAASPSA